MLEHVPRGWRRCLRDFALSLEGEEGDKEGGNVEFKKALVEERVTARTAMELTLFRGNGVARRSPFLSSRGIVLYKTHVSRVEEAAEGHVPPIQGKALDRKLGGEDGSVTSMISLTFLFLDLFIFLLEYGTSMDILNFEMYVYIYLN